MKEFEVIENIFQNVDNGINENYDLFSISYEIGAEKVDNELVEFPMIKAKSKKNGVTSFFENRVDDLFFRLVKQFNELRELMASKDNVGLKWTQVTMHYEKGKAIEMDYVYPDQEANA